MANIFNSIQSRFKKRNKFDLSHQSRLTTEFGRLTPILCEPVLPNDRFSISTTLKVQFAPMVFPVMQKFNAYVHYFFVPNRLLWDKWEEFITGGEDGLAEPDYPVLNVTANFVSAVENSDDTNLMGNSHLFDYLGFPSVDDTTEFTSGHDFDALPFKAYHLIWNEWYRDQNLSQPFDIHTERDGVQALENDAMDSDNVEFQMDLLTLRNRAWRKDYFTSALPDPQRGPDVTLPLVGNYDIVEADGASDVLVTVNRYQSGATYDNAMAWDTVRDVDNNNRRVMAGNTEQVPEGEPVVLYGDADPGDIARRLEIQRGEGEDEVRSATINEVRRAFAVQRWYELAARAGSRYIEQIFAHFGIRSSDARLQRPEFIGGGVVPVYVGDVLQTSETTSDGTPLGTPAGVAQAMGNCHLKKRYLTFEEHGWIIGILSIIPEASYFQGIPRKFLKREKFDFAWPLLANLGEQEIQKQELYFDHSRSKESNMAGFGYTPRYAEYKFGQGQVHGDFRGSLLDFHDARMFDRVPALNQEFIEVRTPSVDATAGEQAFGLNRVFAVQDNITDHLWVYLFNNVRVRRVLPKYGTPI